MTAGVFSRERLGLRSDQAYVAALVGSDADVGTAAWSIPMTADEMEQVDLAGRTAFLRQAEADLIPFVQGLDTFAGMWQDQRHGGRLVVLLTDVDPSVTARIEEHAPEDSLGIKVVQAKHTYAELERATRRLTDDWQDLMPGVGFQGVALDQRDNLLGVDVVDGEMDRAQEHVDEYYGSHDVYFAIVKDALPPLDVNIYEP